MVQRRPLRVGLVVATLGAALAGAGAAQAATITVGTVADVVAADGVCSLREAVQAANADAAAGGCSAGAGTDVIAIPAGTFTLSGAPGVLQVTTDLTLRGAGAAATVIQAQGTQILTIGDLQPPSVTVEGITFRDGRAPAGATAPNVTGANGGAGQNGGLATSQPGGAGANGGAISNNAGTLTVLACRFEGNIAGKGGDGGQAQGGNPGPGALFGGAATGGQGGDGGSGGAIYSLGPLVVLSSTFIDNSGGTGGNGGAAIGGIGGNATSATGSGGTGGPANGGRGRTGGPGGAIDARESLTIEDSTFVGNGSGQGGRGGVAAGGPGGTGGLTSGIGGAGGDARAGDGGFAGNGGAIHNPLGQGLVVKRSSLRLNFVGAAGSGGAATGGTGGNSRGPGAVGGAGGQAIGGAGDIAGDGGAIRSQGNTITIERSYVAGTFGGVGGAGGAATGGRGGNVTNESASAQGGAGGNATGGAGSAGGFGALTTNPPLSLVNTTVDGSSFGGGGRGGDATGGAGGTGEPAGNIGSGGSATGGNGGAAGAAGIASRGGQAVTIRSVTLSALATPGAAAGGNATSGGPGGASTGGSPGSAGGGNGAALVSSGGGTVTATLIVGSGPTACTGPLTNGGFNLEFPRPGETPTCPATPSGDPQLAAAGDFGGPTWTRPLGNSIGVDLVPAGAACPATDQRGVSRPRGSACDVGAYERAAPTATTGAADGVTSAAATVRGTVNPNGRGGTVRFEYGTTAAYGTGTPDTSLPAGLAEVPVSAALTGLQPGTTYHFRVVASTADGTTTGADGTFTTTGVPGSGSGPPPGGGTTPDRTAPVLSTLRLSPTSFRAAARGASISATRVGTILRYTLSEAARTRITVERATTGRRVGPTCRRTTSANRRRARCTRFVAVKGSATHRGAKGANRLTFRGRIGGRKLAVRRYRLVARATDAAGNRSALRRVAFRIVRR